MNIVRWSVLVLTVIMITSCKVQIDVPEGGSVSYSSGAYNCASSETCIIDVGDLLFDETFTATPEEGYAFIAWRKRDRGFFGGETNPSVRLYTSDFPSFPVLLPFLETDDVFYLEPAFCEDTSISYSQDFEAMTPGGGYPPNDLEADGWQIFGAEFTVNPYTNPDAEPVNSYGPFYAADGDPGSIQAIASNEGGPKQGVQHLNKYTDYNNAGQATNFVEGITLQQRTVAASDVGTWTLVFDAKRKSEEDFGVGGQSSAYAFIKTLDPSAFFQKGYVEKDMTSAGGVDKWGTYSISLEITADMVGDLMQFGFSATAFNYEPSGIYYDNLFFGTCAGLPVD